MMLAIMPAIRLSFFFWSAAPEPPAPSATWLLMSNASAASSRSCLAAWSRFSCSPGSDCACGRAEMISYERLARHGRGKLSYRRLRTLVSPEGTASR